MGMAAFRVGMEIGRDRASMCMVDAQGGVQCRRLFSAASTPSPERFADTLCDHLEDMLLKRGMMPAEVRHIGVAVAGQVDRSLAQVIHAPDVFGTAPVALASLIEGRIGVTPLVMGEACAAANAELRFGAGAPDFLCITLGRHSAVAVVRQGKIALDETAAATDAALNALRQTAVQTLSTHALTRLAVERFPEAFAAGKPSIRDVLAHAEAGDAPWIALIDAAAKTFASELREVMAACRVPAAAVGGMLAAHGETIMEPLARQLVMAAERDNPGAEPLTLRPAVYGGDAVMVGAAFFSAQVFA